MDWDNILAGQVKDITTAQMIVRGLIVFAYGLVIIRFAGHRIFGKMGAFDIVLSVIIGSNLSRAVTGNTPMIPCLIATTVLVLVHLALSYLSVAFPRLGWLVKGEAFRLLARGKPDEHAMRRHGISHGDLQSAMREESVDDPAQVEEAWLERNGDLSIVKKKG